MLATFGPSVFAKDLDNHWLTGLSITKEELVRFNTCPVIKSLQWISESEFPEQHVLQRHGCLPDISKVSIGQMFGIFLSNFYEFLCSELSSFLSSLTWSSHSDHADISYLGSVFSKRLTDFSVMLFNKCIHYLMHCQLSESFNHLLFPKIVTTFLLKNKMIRTNV